MRARRETRVAAREEKRVVSLLLCISRLAPSATHVVICVSRAFCPTDKQKRETARGLGIQRILKSFKLNTKINIAAEKNATHQGSQWSRASKSCHFYPRCPSFGELWFTIVDDVLLTFSWILDLPPYEQTWLGRKGADIARNGCWTQEALILQVNKEND